MVEIFGPRPCLSSDDTRLKAAILYIRGPDVSMITSVGCGGSRKIQESFLSGLRGHNALLRYREQVEHDEILLLKGVMKKL